MQGQEMVPAWRGLLRALRSGKQSWAEARPAEAAAGLDFWGYLEVIVCRGDLLVEMRL